jgi:hypothetical protein
MLKVWLSGAVDTPGVRAMTSVSVWSPCSARSRAVDTATLVSVLSRGRRIFSPLTMTWSSWVGLGAS